MADQVNYVVRESRGYVFLPPGPYHQIIGTPVRSFSSGTASPPDLIVSAWTPCGVRNSDDNLETSPGSINGIPQVSDNGERVETTPQSSV